MTTPICAKCPWPADWKLNDDDRTNAVDEGRPLRTPLITRVEYRCHRHVFTDIDGLTFALRLFDADGFAGFGITPAALSDAEHRQLIEETYMQRTGARPN